MMMGRLIRTVGPSTLLGTNEASTNCNDGFQIITAQHQASVPEKGPAITQRQPSTIDSLQPSRLQPDAKSSSRTRHIMLINTANL
jgi:hypothetical protein